MYRLFVGSGLGSVALGAALALRLRCLLFLVVAFLGFAQGGTEDVAEGRTGIGRAILRHGFLLFGDFQRLDRDRHFAGLGIGLGHHGIELLANAEALRPLLGTVARQIGTADKAGEIVIDQFDVEATVFDASHLARDAHALLQLAAWRIGGKRIGRELLDAEADPLFFGVSLQNHGLHVIALLVIL